MADSELLTLNLAQMTIESTNVQLPLQPPLLIADVSGSNSWDEWLSETETKLRDRGYIKYTQNYKHEDFCYWKTFKNGDEKLYIVGVLFYDFRKNADINSYSYRIGIMYECMLSGEDRIDMSVSKNIDLDKFENMAYTFYHSMSQYYR